MSLSKYNSSGSPLIQDLNKINKLLKIAKTDRQEFINNYQLWASQRKKTVFVFQKLRNDLNRVHLASSCGRSVGTGVGILGSIAAIVGAGLQFSNKENLKSVGKEMSKYGAIAGTVGTIGSVSSTVVEYGFNKRILEEVKTALAQDQQLTENMMPWLRNSQELDTLFKRVFDCSILSDTVNDISIIVENIMILVEKGDKTREDIQRLIEYGIHNSAYALIDINTENDENVEKSIEKIESMSCKVKYVLREFCSDLGVCEAMREIYNSCERSPLIFEFSKLGLQVVLKISNFSNLKIFASVLSFLGTDALALANAVTPCVFTAIKISRDVVKFLSAVKDIKNGKSKYSKLLEETEEILLVELRNVTDANNKFMIKASKRS